MLIRTRNWMMAATVAMLVACGGGGGGDRATGVDPGPPPSDNNTTPPPPTQPNPAPALYAQAEELFATITSVTIPADGRPVIEWQLTDGNNVAITDLGDRNVRFTLAKLMESPLGNLTGTWQSYISDIEEPTPGVGPATEDKLQADYERPGDTDDGEFTNNGDGSYRYRMQLNVNALDPDWLAQAEAEGLNLDYEPSLPHRVAAQFDGSNDTANPFYDWVPASGAKPDFTMDIAATANCNRCHDPLGIHGGNRREIQYCVTCHNAGTTDANSGNTVDMKVMIHKIHMGRNLPSVADGGGDYTIWGFQDRPHDYSDIAYPQDPRNCINCHVGTETVGDREDLVITAQGDNWAQVPSRAACGSCHDDEVWADHAGGQADDLACASCHTPSGSGLSVTHVHRQEVMQARQSLLAKITAVDNTAAGQFPTVSFRISNPLTGENYDIMNDPVFTDEDARIAVGIAWDTDDYTNTGNFDDDTSASNASQVQANALTSATPNGDGSYSITMPVAIPDGSRPPFVKATGSGVATVEGHPIFDLDENNDGVTELTSVSVGDATRFFSIDEVDGEADERRASVDIDNCLSCHQTLVLHGDNRADNIDSCVSCHNPRNTDRRVREQGKATPGRAVATDGKDEESIDFKTMIHAIHAAGIRENPLQVVGFMAFSLHVYDEEHVHYPGNLANCTACHTDDGFILPLADSVLGPSVHTGSNRNSPADDTVATPAAAVCSSCHDDAVAKSHMEVVGGGNFATTQGAIDDGDVIETCHVCHGEDRSEDAWEHHQAFLD